MASIALNKNKKATKTKPQKRKGKVLPYLQRIGKSLLFPIAMLPFAAIMLRVGAEIPGDVSKGASQFSHIINMIMTAIGNAVFSNLHIIFAVGIAFGLSRDSRGEAAMVGLVVMILLMSLMASDGTFGKHDLVNVIYGKVDFGQTAIKDASGNVTYAKGFHTLFATTDSNGKIIHDSYDAILANNVLNGIFVGITVSVVYNKFNGIELPSVLGFFSGRRLIPVLGFIFGILAIIGWAIIFPWIGFVIFKFSDVLIDGASNRWSNAAIMGIYGFINRLLIPFGLHHIPNTLFWFTMGSFPDATGAQVHGDINIFINGVAKNNPAGTFQSGFFPIMMFGLPALAVAFWFNADGDVQKKRVASLLFGSAIVSFFTGITEPIEFSFMFMAPMLYGMHAILTGLFGFITGLFGIQLGFGFSAGLIDYALSIPKSMDIIRANKTGIDAVMANPAWLFLIGGAAAASYFFGATLLIRKFNVSAPGRGENKIADDNSEEQGPIAEGDTKYTKDAKAILEGVGGSKNIEQLEWCATRLRFTLKDASLINDAQVKKTMAMGTIKIGANGYQVIIGPKVEMMGEEIKKHM
ncbi:PTS transporter subunit EIIC [Mycoplasma todarodis]|uniref:PTS glucose transporter subunit IIABC n=1 Tax=Mycoplasma todarodis TaxID=1937191 RepID=A0A4R0XRK4_9MOLU|nr:PTS transporter subunit EIIC [Mycoplasma todarodis]TCG11505.1 PTS glucose transporter subunit IIABC [Mycoplasma todarodis]